MNRRTFFAAVAGFAVAPKIAPTYEPPLKFTYLFGEPIQIHGIESMVYNNKMYNNICIDVSLASKQFARDLADSIEAAQQLGDEMVKAGRVMQGKRDAVRPH